MPKVKVNIDKLKHPNSRKTLALIKQAKKASNRQKIKIGHSLKQQVVADKILWFKERLLPDVPVYNAVQTTELIEQYLGRFDDELEQIELKHSIGGRKNRQHASREDIIRLTKKRELEEYDTCGLEIPNLLDKAQMKILREWDGDLRFFQHFKLKRFSRSNLQTLADKEEKNETVEMEGGQ